MREKFGSVYLRELSRKEGAKYDQKYFSQDYWKEDLPGKTGNRNLSYLDPNHEKRFDWLHSIMPIRQEVRKVLDAGCGPGLLLERMLKVGVDAYGVDISKYAFHKFSDRVGAPYCSRFLLAGLAEIPFDDSEFDLTICLDTLEHLVVNEALRAVEELCRVSQKTIVTSINIDNPYDFHPTILSRETWIALFHVSGKFVLDENLTHKMQSEAATFRPEYDFFCFSIR